MKKFWFAIALLSLNFNSRAQDDIPVDNSLSDNDNSKVEKIFPTIQIFNLPTTTLLPKGEMKLYLAHRMGVMGTGLDGLFGLYQANSRFGADLGLNRFLNIGIGSTSQQKLYDGYLKTRIIKQSNKFPLEISAFTSIAISALKPNYPEDKQATWQQVFYTNELLFSRAFSNRFSGQLAFAHVHKNMVATAKDKNDIISFGGALNLKTGRMIYLAAEYMYLPANQVVSTEAQQHIVSLGVQIHTGPRHVFQIFLSNAVGIVPGTVLTETQQKFTPKNLRICFNIPTTFNIFK
ncbi:MAG: hypothetical protein HPY79_12095 [Bacteroidales bacterium]|nr:hypothetical protein [Bacteroidales bacterium]